MSYLPPHAQPDFPGLLTDSQAQTLAQVQKGMLAVNRAILRLNGLIINGNLRLTLVSAPSVGSVYGETLRMVFEHELAESKLRRSADAPERMAA